MKFKIGDKVIDRWGGAGTVIDAVYEIQYPDHRLGRYERDLEKVNTEKWYLYDNIFHEDYEFYCALPFHPAWNNSLFSFMGRKCKIIRYSNEDTVEILLGSAIFCIVPLRCLRRAER